MLLLQIQHISPHNTAKLLALLATISPVFTVAIFLTTSRLPILTLESHVSRKDARAVEHILNWIALSDSRSMRPALPVLRAVSPGQLTSAAITHLQRVRCALRDARFQLNDVPGAPVTCSLIPQTPCTLRQRAEHLLESSVFSIDPVLGRSSTRLQRSVVLAMFALRRRLCSGGREPFLTMVLKSPIALALHLYVLVGSRMLRPTEDDAHTYGLPVPSTTLQQPVRLVCRCECRHRGATKCFLLLAEHELDLLICRYLWNNRWGPRLVTVLGWLLLLYVSFALAGEASAIIGAIMPTTVILQTALYGLCAQLLVAGLVASSALLPRPCPGGSAFGILLTLLMRLLPGGIASYLLMSYLGALRVALR